MDASVFWTDLFAAAHHGSPYVERSFSSVSKRGHPFLLLPDKRGPALRTLQLYPAQTSRGRCSRRVLACAVCCGLSFGRERAHLHFSTADPFMRFLAAQTGDPTKALPVFGAMAGNPSTTGRRFVVLVFDERGRPRALVKAGTSEAAQKLIRRESGFLLELQDLGDIPGTPGYGGSLEDARVSAFSIPFYVGESPQADDYAGAAELLEGWLRPGEQGPVTHRGPWRRLEEVAGGLPLFQGAASKLESRPMAGSLFHGDFAPWNIKVNPKGVWRVIDWERGEINGVPGWDWFHYAIQPAVLVEKRPATEVVDKAQRIMRGYLFRNYAAKAGCLQLERELLVSYLLFCIHVVRPSEGMNTLEEMLTLVARQS